MHPKVDAELAAAALSHDTVAVQIDGKTYEAPMSEVNTDMFEVACDDHGCVLIPDDGNPHNDLIPDQKQEPKQDDHSNNDQPLSSHGMELKIHGGDVQVHPQVDAELAAAALSHDTVAVQIDGKTYEAPMSEVNTDMFEVACDDHGCVLIPDDGNPHNDLIPDQKSQPAPYVMAPQHDLGHQQQDVTYYDDQSQAHHGPISTHGIELPMVGGNYAMGADVNAEIAAAAYNADSAVIVHEGQTYLAPIGSIDPQAVELACIEDKGCALIKDDGNPNNDIILPNMDGYSGNGMDMHHPGMDQHYYQEPQVHQEPQYHY